VTNTAVPGSGVIQFLHKAIGEALAVDLEVRGKAWMNGWMGCVEHPFYVASVATKPTHDIRPASFRTLHPVWTGTAQ